MTTTEADLAVVMNTPHPSGEDDAANQFASALQQRSASISKTTAQTVNSGNTDAIAYNSENHNEGMTVTTGGSAGPFKKQ